MKTFKLVITTVSGTMVSAMCVAILLLTSQYINAQEKEDTRDYTINLHQYVGAFLNQSNAGFIGSLNGQFQNKNLFGLGIEGSSGFYQSPALNKTPVPSEISNFPEDGFNSQPAIRVNGTDKDYYGEVTIYGSKELVISRFFAVDFQAGPSLTFIEERSYSYSYVGGSGGSFGGFFCCSGSYIRATSQERDLVTVGGHLRAVIKAKLGKVFRLELSPFANINSINTTYGLQLGVGFQF